MADQIEKTLPSNNDTWEKGKDMSQSQMKN